MAAGTWGEVSEGVRQERMLRRGGMLVLRGGGLAGYILKRKTSIFPKGVLTRFATAGASCAGRAQSEDRAH